MLGEGLYGANGRGADMVLHALDIVIDGLGIQAKELEEICKELVTVRDISRKVLPCSCQHKPTVLFIFEQAFCVEFLNHVSDAGLRYGKSLRDVHNTRVTLGVDELENLLEIIFNGGRGWACCITWGHLMRVWKAEEGVNLRGDVAPANKVR